MTDWRYLPDTHVRPERTGEPNWRWLDLWEQENPRPSPDLFHVWEEQYTKVVNRIWVAYCLPDFLVWDWPEGDVEAACKLLRYHVCSVCGVADDPGCSLNC